MKEPILHWVRVSPGPSLLDKSDWWSTLCPCGCRMETSESERAHAERMHFVNDNCGVPDVAGRVRDQMWKSEDPRLSVNKHAIIIVVDQRNAFLHASSANVETKNGWSVCIMGPGFDGYRLISADDTWPEGFVWAWAPKDGKI